MPTWRRIADGVQALVGACAAGKVFALPSGRRDPTDAEQRLQYSAPGSQHWTPTVRNSTSGSRRRVRESRCVGRMRDVTVADEAAATTLRRRLNWRAWMRARAARLLRTVVNERRDAARARTVQRTAATSSGRSGPAVVRHRRYDSTSMGPARRLPAPWMGRPCPSTKLSMGTRERIGIIARLACAMLVDEHDGVPVIIDDAPGPPTRTGQRRIESSRGPVRMQVIVLTCSPERYRDVESAQTVAL